MSILDNEYIVKMPDGSKWSVPIVVIAEHRAKIYAEIDGISFENSLNDDTIPLFEEDPYEIHDWASNNMNWNYVKIYAIRIDSPDVDFQEGWINGDWEIKNEHGECIRRKL